MGCDQRPPVTRHELMRGFGLALLVFLAGCGGHANVQANSGNVSSGGSVNIPGRSTMGTLFSIVFLAGVSHEGDRAMPRSAQAPEPDSSRRVVAQDCTKPIEDSSANLKCR
jgi:hypothetical protein